jgi:nicotinate-nucleotide adenylyltransferase
MFALAHIVVAIRPGCDLNELPAELQDEVESRWTADPSAIRHSPHGLVMGLDLTPRHESASALRKRIASEQTWANDVPPAVAAYIYDHQLYGSNLHAR